MGRPRLYPDCADSYAFCVRVRGEEKEAISRMATRLGKSEIEIKRMAVEKGLEILLGKTEK